MSRKSFQQRKFHMSRRQALGAMGAAGAISAFSNPIGALLNGLVQGIFARAQAGPGVPLPTYMLYCMGGGPPGYIFQPMAPYESIANVAQDARGHANTRFLPTPSGGRFADLSSVPVTVAGVTTNMPNLWASKIPTVGGGWTDMSQLMANMMMVNSFTREADGHQADSLQLERPLGSPVSIAGAVADRSARPVPAAAMGESPAALFRAHTTGLVYSEGKYQNLNAILDPFNRPSGELASSYLSRRDAMDVAVNSVMSALGSLAGSNQPGADALWSVAGRAEAQVRQGVGDLANEYASRLAKYQDLIMRSKDYSTYPMMGITDRPVAYSSLPKDSKGNCWLTLTMYENKFATNADLRTILGPDTTVEALAESFAVAEYLLSRGFSSSFIGATSGPAALAFQNPLLWGMPPTSAGPANGNWYNDSHAGSPLIDLIAFGFMYRSIAACVYELIRVLKSSTVAPFDQSVIQIAGEFGRSSDDPYSVQDADGVTRYHGTGHGWWGANTTIFSGMIKRPYVFGNPYRNAGGSGTWGGAGKTLVGGVSRKLVYGNVCSTIATLLETENPTPNDQALLAKNTDGSVAPTIDLAKITDAA
jgi:hypothetical protein